MLNLQAISKKSVEVGEDGSPAFAINPNLDDIASVYL